MADESFEVLFGACVLEVLTPDASISFPEDVIVDDWLASAKQPHTERKQAFFDEHLNLFLVMRVEHPSLSNSHDRNPPRTLANLLSHIQVSLEATYISQTPNQDVPDTPGLALPRVSSMQKGRPSSFHPSIFPPNTPNPIPSTTESDRKYVQSEGTLLVSGIWGAQKAVEESKERFALLFSEAHSCWIAIYELSLIVSYLRLPFPNPLLCLTASATLRDKAISPTQSSHPFVAYLIRMGMVSHLDPGALRDNEDDDEDEEDEDTDTGFEEINLLEGLSLDPNVWSDSESFQLPSTRLGNTTRQQFFSLTPLSLQTRTPPSTSRQTPSHILRKSYRKTLQAVSGFRVRMRTVFVPHVLFPKKSSASEIGKDAGDHDDFEGGNEEREAGNSERTVVLCVEVENSGESGSTMGFSLEHLDVKIGGEGATTRLIGWGEGAFSLDTKKRFFPLHIGSMEQYNLLYVVSFWNTPNDQESLLTGQNTCDSSELQRAVTITVYGRPYLTSEVRDDNDILSYPTQTFSSRWNCVLDLSSRPREEPSDFHETSVGRSALPEPPSPFPGRSALSSLIAAPATITPVPLAIAGKRNTLPGSITAMRAINPHTSMRLSLPLREHPGGSAAPSASTTAFTPPSVALQAFNRFNSTTFGMTPPPPGGGGGFNTSVPLSDTSAQSFVTSPKSAYPTFPPGATANTPHVQETLGMGKQQGYSGPSVEIKRERGAGMIATVPQTPLPTVLKTKFDARPEALPVPSGEPIVVSVGLLPDELEPPSSGGHLCGQRKIFPADQFTLDIFVFNQSSWTRRFEVTYPSVDKRLRRVEENKATSGSSRESSLEELKASISPPGILPLQNRIRVGPLKPSTCQSVRMDFLAISPGVHSVDTLTLTDVGTGYAVNLRSVMDIVVHERTVEKEEKFP